MAQTSVDKARIATQFLSAIPHAKALGIRLDDIGDGDARMSIPYDENLIGDPDTGVIHGGVVFALIDTCGGTAVMTHPSGAVGTATLDLRVDYMRGATPGQRITAHAECYHVTRTVAFVRVTATDEEEGVPIATAHGAFTVDSGRRK